jgi:outer membrane protein TolC
MNKKTFIIVAACHLAALSLLGAQNTKQGQASAPSAPLPELNLDGVLSASTAAGDDFIINAGSLDVARKQRALDLAKQGLLLSASGSYLIADGIGKDNDPNSSIATADQALISKAVSASSGGGNTSGMNGLAQSPTGSLSLSLPLTKATLSVSHTIPVPQPSNLLVVPSSVAGLTLNQTLWDGYPGGQYRGALAQSLLSLNISLLSAQLGTSAAITKVKQAYITMLAAQRDLDIKIQVLGKQQSLLAQIQAIFDLKQATSIDLLTAQVNVRSAQIDVDTADKTLRLANERLAVIMGRTDPHDRFRVAEIADPQLPAATVEDAIAIGLQKRTDVAQLDLRAQSSHIGALLSLAQAQPNLSLTGGLGTAIGWASVPVVAGALSVGAKVSLPVYDSGTADLQARTSEGQAILFGYQATQLRKTLASDIRDFFESAALQTQKVSLAKDSMDLADRQFDLVQAQNTYGTATLQDVLTASVNRSTAEVNYQTARSAYLSAVLQLSTAMGL